jgi:TolA-binding protein
LRIDPTTFAAVLAFVTFIFAVVGVAGTWRAARSTSALNQYRETARAWEGKATAQAMQLKDLETGSAQKDQRIAELEGKVAVLQDALTGRVAWDILEAKITEALQLMGETRTEVKQVHQILEDRT